MFSARHYRFLATFLASELNRPGIGVSSSVCVRLADALARDNTRFDKERFLDYIADRVEFNPPKFSV